jgi:hypothetical protein
MKQIVLITLFLLVGCAVTPEQMEAKAKNMSDEGLCWEVAMGNLTTGFYVNELKERKVNCKNYQDIIIENRKRQIQTGIALSGLGDALGGRPVQQRQAPPLPTWFPDYSK